MAHNSFWWRALALPYLYRVRTQSSLSFINNSNINMYSLSTLKSDGKGYQFSSIDGFVLIVPFSHFTVARTMYRRTPSCSLSPVALTKACYSGCRLAELHKIPHKGDAKPEPPTRTLVERRVRLAAPSSSLPLYCSASGIMNVAPGEACIVILQS